MLPGIFEVSQAVDIFCHLQLRAELGCQLSRKLAAIECMFLLLCTFHKRLEGIVFLIFIYLSLPSSLVHLCSRVTICQLKLYNCFLLYFTW
jgi:hypothetical protein